MWITNDGQWKVETEPSKKGTSFVTYRWSKLLGRWQREGHSDSLAKVAKYFGMNNLVRVEIPDEVPDEWPSNN